MFTLLESLRALVKDDRGVTAQEYGLIAGLLAVVIVTSVTTLGKSLSETSGAISTALTSG
jgi:pilus assembly protein Flp/PilA